MAERPRYRPRNTRDETKLIFIMGDGESESTYFDCLNRELNGIRLRTEVLDKVGWKNKIRKCKGRVNSGEIDLKGGDELIIVTDEDKRFDDKSIIDFQNECVKNGFRLILSNVSFEVWLLMHYEQLTRPYEQDELENRLSYHLGHPYAKSKGIPFTMDMVDKAVKNSKEKLTKEDNIECFHINPSTLVGFFVEDIVKRGHIR